MKYLELDDIGRIRSIKIAAIQFLNIQLNDSKTVRDDSIIEWINDAFGIVSGMAIVDDLILTDLVKRGDDGLSLGESGIEYLKTQHNESL